MQFSWEERQQACMTMVHKLVPYGNLSNNQCLPLSGQAGPPTAKILGGDASFFACVVAHLYLALQT